MTIEITFPSGKKNSYAHGVQAEQIIDDPEFEALRPEIVAVRLNNEITSLSYPVSVNSTIEPVLLSSPAGAVLYRKTLCFLLTVAARSLFPDKRLVIGHALGEGYYYQFDGSGEVSKKEIGLLRDRMNELIGANDRIQHSMLSYVEAVRYFQHANMPHTALFLKYHNMTKVPIHQCGKYIDLMHGPLLSYTGKLHAFELRPYPPGFLLRYPLQGDVNKIAPFKDNPLLFSIYQEYKSWGKILGMSCLGRLNQLIVEGNAKEFIQVAEALQDKKIARIADQICSKRDITRLVLIAGPSSSGKTTFTKKLTIQLRVLGRNPITVSMDDYFLPRIETPVDSHGEPDLEALEAIDVDLLNSHFLRLFEGNEIQIPRFDFKTGTRREHGQPLRLSPRSILILEGIHGLNNRLTPQIDRELKFKIYISALTQLNLDDHTRIRATDNRLIRRIVRDYQFRGNCALDTLKMWPAVRSGENKNIFPFQDSADAAFNSSLDYELSVLKVYAEPLLRTIKPTVIEYSEAKRLLSFLEGVLPLTPSIVPPQSILREFIGESEFEY